MRGDAASLVTVYATVDGQVLLGEPCPWPQRCAGEPLGTWTAEHLILHGDQHPWSELVHDTTVRVSPTAPWSFDIRSDGSLGLVPRLASRASSTARLQAQRPADRDWSSPRALAAAVGLAQQVETSGGAAPPPPPPPPG